MDENDAKPAKKKRKPGPKIGLFGKKIQKHICMSQGLYERLAELARDQNISMSSWLERAVMHAYRTQRALTWREKVRLGQQEGDPSGDRELPPHPAQTEESDEPSSD